MILTIVIVIAVVSGLAAAGVALILLDRRKRNGGKLVQTGMARLALPSAAFAVAAIVVGALLFVFVQPGGNRPERRLLESIERHHPETAAEVAAISSEPDSRLSQKKAADLAQRYFARHLTTTSDAAVLQFTAEMTRIFESLQQRDPETCKALASGGNVSAGLDPQRMRPALDAMAAVINDSVDAAQPPPDPARAQQLLSGVVQRVYAAPKTELLPPQALMQAATAPADKLCNTMIAFYREILALPPQDGSTVLRVLMRSGQGPR